VDEQNPPKSEPEILASADPEQRSLLGAPCCVVFSGDEELVRKGFLIALRAMGIDRYESGEDPNA
jgi:hypothetical protein